MRRYAFLVMSLLLVPAPAYAWGSLGHRLIARLAMDYMSSDTRKEVNRLLQGATPAQVASWADSIRSTRRETDNWHFINVPLSAPIEDWQRYCPQDDCIIGQLERFETVLANRRHSDGERAEALRFIIHFVGDLHMPLHVGGRADRGGNDVAVTWQGRPTNLHAVWDSYLIGSVNLAEDQWFGRLRKSARRLTRKGIQSGGLVDWARESLEVSRDFVYQVPTPPELSGDYAAQNLPRVEDRLARGGLRLAALLNQLLRK